MARALDEALGSRLIAGVVTGSAPAGAESRWQPYAATHPKPSAASEAAGRAALAVADQAHDDKGLLIVCLSGGASAMLAVPAPGLTIEDKAAATGRMLLSGCDISELNLVRRHLSAIKGGQLAARAGRSITLAISDVCTPVEDDPKVIGSGPTAGDDTTFAEALAVVDRYGGRVALSPRVVAHLEAGAAGRAAGPVPGDDARLRSAAYWIVGSRHDAMKAAAGAARAIGYHVHVVPGPTIGEARQAGVRIVEAGHNLAGPACVIASGETTVRVVGRGRGGRNQELAVAAIEPLAAIGRAAALASIGTDGADGPTDAAGAYVDSESLHALGSSGREEIARTLAENDAYPLLDRIGALVKTGPTGTNVGDLQVLIVE